MDNLIPILYDKHATEFDNFGIGMMNDTISCTVTEIRNGSYELEMKYPQTGILFNSIELLCFIKAIPSYNTEPDLFRIYNISKPLNGIITINAEHVSYQLSYIPVMPFSATSCSLALNQIFAKSVENVPFTISTDIESSAKFNLDKPISARSLLGGSSKSILDVYGGEYKFHNYDITLYRNRGTDRGVSLRYGKNIIDLKQEENIASTVTGICPYWADQDGNIVTLTDNVVYSEYAKNYPYQRTIVKDFSDAFQTKPSEEQLREKALDYVNKTGLGLPKVNLDVKFVVLQQMDEYKDVVPFLEAVNLCDVITVEFESLSISVKSKVVKTIWNVLTDSYESVSLGSISSTLSRTIQTIEETSKIALDNTRSVLDIAIDNATKKITGVDGGYVVMNQDANGQPYEILIMDKPSIETATKVWRWNKEGLGYSSTGYDGPYGLAMTSDGKIVADYITAGTLEGITVKGNTIIGGTISGSALSGNTGEIGGWAIEENHLTNTSEPWTSDSKIRRAFLNRPIDDTYYVYAIQHAKNTGKNPTGGYDLDFAIWADGDMQANDISCSKILSDGGVKSNNVIEESFDGGTTSLNCVGSKTVKMHFEYGGGGVIVVYVNNQRVGTLKAT